MLPTRPPFPSSPYGPEPPAAPPLGAPHEPSVENLLLRFGLVTLDQLGAAMREQTETGTPFTDVLVRDGAVSAEDLARVQDRTPAPLLGAPLPPVTDLAPAPETAAAPPPVEPEPAPVPAEPAPLAPAATASPASRDESSRAPEQGSAAVFELPQPPVTRDESSRAPGEQPAPAALVVTGYVVRGRLVNGDEIEIASVDEVADAQRLARDAMRACARPTGDWPILSGRYVRPDSIVSIEVAESYDPA